MHFLIDGYNLLYAVGLRERGSGPGGLERARLALLNFLAESLGPSEAPKATVVFDAHESPPGLPKMLHHHGLMVRYAVRYEDADTLIEELIREESAPRRLTVVSSDHRLQRAAHRRKAKAIDSDVWYAELLRLRAERHRASRETDPRPPVPLLAEDVEYWVRQFGGAALLEQLAGNMAVEPGEEKPASPHPSAERSPTVPAPDKAAEAAEPGHLGPLENPVPEGKRKKGRTADDGGKIGPLEDPLPKRKRRKGRTADDRGKIGPLENLLPKRKRRKGRTADDRGKVGPLENPFPPGYGEDLLEGEDI